LSEFTFTKFKLIQGYKFKAEFDAEGIPERAAHVIRNMLDLIKSKQGKPMLFPVRLLSEKSLNQIFMFKPELLAVNLNFECVVF